MRKTRRIDIVSLAILTIYAGGVASLRAAEKPAAPTGPRVVVGKVVADALSILRDSKLSAEDKRQKVQQIAYDNINFDVMSRLSLGRYYRDLADAKRTQYAEAFKTHVTNTYRHTTDHYTDEDVKVVGDRQEADNDWTVQTRIIGTKDNKPGQELAKVDYRLRSKDGRWLVIDMTIDGVSLVANFRSQFQDIMANGGIDKLLKLLNDKNAANEN